MIVLDASAAVELALKLSLGDAVARRIADPTDQLHAPQLLTVEVLHVLRRRVGAGLTTSDRATAALRAFLDLDVTYHDHTLLAMRIWALRQNLSAYDATYVALAELLAATVLTTDARLARAPGHTAKVELIGP